MKIIGHRGAKGLATENTLASLILAIENGVDAVEFDLRVTGDSKLVLHHDSNLKRVYGIDAKISEHSLGELRNLTKGHKDPINSLDEALDVLNEFPQNIELKDQGSAEILILSLKNRNISDKSCVVSFNPRILQDYQKLGGKLPVRYNIDIKHVLTGLKNAKNMKVDGVSYRTYNLFLPINLILARFTKLEICIDPVKYGWQAIIIKLINPKINLIVDYPDRIRKI